MANFGKYVIGAVAFVTFASFPLVGEDMVPSKDVVNPDKDNQEQVDHQKQDDIAIVIRFSPGGYYRYNSWGPRGYYNNSWGPRGYYNPYWHNNYYYWYR